MATSVGNASLSADIKLSRPAEADVTAPRPLFRVEAMVPRSNNLYGPISLARSVSSWILVTVTLAVFLTAVAYASLGSYTKRTTTLGVLLPETGVVRIQSTAPGLVKQSLVKEGQRVEKDQLLMVLGEERRLATQATHQRLAESQHELMRQRRDSLDRTISAIRLAGEENQRTLKARLTTISDQQARNAEEAELLTARIASGTSVVERFQMLARANAASQVEAFEREEQLNALKAQLITSRRQRADLANVAVGIKGELDQNRARTETQLSDFERELAALDQQIAEVESRDSQAITAPMAGIITAINIQPGQQSGTSPLALLLPDNVPLVAQLYPPSRSIGFIEPGQSVRLRFQAYPYQKYGHHAGTVVEVSRSPLPASEISEKLQTVAPGANGSPNNEGLYRVKVELRSQSFIVDGRAIPLLPGMTFEADVMQEKRRIIEWIFEPLLGLSRHMA
jgi:membrane fusion protein